MVLDETTRHNNEVLWCLTKQQDPVKPVVRDQGKIDISVSIRGARRSTTTLVVIIISCDTSCA